MLPTSATFSLKEAKVRYCCSYSWKIVYFMISLSCCLNVKWQIEHKMKYPTVSLIPATSRLDNIARIFSIRTIYSTATIYCSTKSHVKRTRIKKCVYFNVTLVIYSTRMCVFFHTNAIVVGICISHDS